MRRLGTGMALAVLLAAGSAWAKKDFSADVLMKTEAGTKPVEAKLNASGDKMRVEATESEQRSVMIFDQKKSQAWLLVPEHKVVMEVPQDVVGNDLSGLRRENPCDGQDEFTCKRAGSEQVAGRKANKWVATDGSGQQVATFWVDQALAYPLKVERDDFVMELKNVKVGPQPQNLFEIPKDYRQMDMETGVGGAGE